ncbi:MAG: hypothetical protein Q4F67_01420 [Propionibacteriaceae bacterium]|nr:hypothetical protein [Propionibacteriaceae bacterium]
MPKASKLTATERHEIPGAVSVSENFPNGWTVNFETETADIDTTPFYDHLPDKKCQTPHLGYVITGTIRYRSAEGEEVFTAGDAYYVPPGHTSFVHEGTDYVEFSPTKEQAETYQRVVDYWAFLKPGDPLIIAP